MLAGNEFSTSMTLTKELPNV